MKILKPISNWLLKNKLQHHIFSKGNIKSDLQAGFIVALVLIPQCLAYAQLAGLPPVYGLYAAIIPCILGVLFGSSNYLSTGPVAVLSILTATTITPLASPGTPSYVTYVVVLALISGVLQIILGALKAGWLVNFLSHPVVFGFANAAGIVIASTQLATFFGVQVPSTHSYLLTLWHTLQAIVSRGDALTAFVGFASLFIYIVLRHINPRIPGVLIILVLGIFSCWFWDLNIKTISHISNPIPTLAIPQFNFSYLSNLLGGAAIIALIGFTETIAIAQSVAAKANQRIDTDRELIGQGIANIASAFSGGYPVAGSFSRTAINYANGAKTWMSAVFCSLIVLLVTVFFFPVLRFTPNVVLGVIIIVGIAGIINLSKFANMFKVSKPDGIAALITFVGTLLFAPDMEKGILFGLIFSMGYFIYRNTHPNIVFLSRHQDGFLRDRLVYNLKQCKNIAVIRLDAPLFFGNALFFENKIISFLSEHHKVNHIILVAGAISQIDATGTEVLTNLITSLNNSGKEIYMANIKYSAETLFQRTGVWELVKPSHFYPTTQIAVKEVIKMLELENNHTDSKHCPLAEYVRPSSKNLTKDKNLLSAIANKYLLKAFPKNYSK